MSGMRIEDAQLAARRAWYTQWGRCVLISLAFLLIAFEDHRRFGGLLSGNGSAILWVGFAIVAAYIAEQTWHAWRQLQFARNLSAPLTISEFQSRKAQEEWHNSLCGFVLVVSVNLLISLSLRRIVSLQFIMTLWMFPCLPAVRVGKAWRESRRMSA
jgi:hypothetical protein